MTTLTPASAQAIARLRAYVPPPTQYYNLPVTRRAAVLILLFADRAGDLRVVLTMRAGTLRSYAGQAALPGGKADFLSETPFATARREAYEEIGLPLLDSKLPPPFRVEHLCQLPTHLAKTELGVRPCVAFLSPSSSPSATSSQTAYPSSAIPSVETTLIPRLDAKEVAAVFTAPFHNFLRERDEKGGVGHTTEPASESPGVEAAGWPREWYRGAWTDWHETRWRMHNFYVPISDQKVTKPRPRTPSKSSKPQPKITHPSPPEEKVADPLEGLTRFRVFGMTARILVDAARVAYNEEPEFEHNAHFGDEDMIARLLKIGRLSEKRGERDELTRDVLRKAATAKM
ncbi:NUDIX domain-containing protein [Lepidopterella palustris CBS 459.81]|uniref:NUDIX domain-containing protein n=1 Tax=Lepidopterella palustris CBS 459.81 TaxID=1314670 RepID=A0A8E2EBU9_9PEZI|nr:NUDIX domain-containing protein [Lepidopterella palustris CBS 459.81]